MRPGPKKKKTLWVNKLPNKPIRLKQLIAQCKIKQEELAISCGVGRTTLINVLSKHGYFPERTPEFKSRAETFVRLYPPAQQWLEKHNLEIADIWEPLTNNIKRMRAKQRRRRSIKPDGYKKRQTPQSPVLHRRRGQMLNPDTMKHFKIFRHPFIDDVQRQSDIYMSAEHVFAKQVMVDAANYGGFVAIIGEVGSGKSVMRRAVTEQLKREDKVDVIYPQTIDKTRLTASAICDAIVLDISSEKPNIRLEAKSRQVLRLLLDRSKNGRRHVMILEEAHDLSINTLKYLKRFYELEDGFRKLLAIILVGQLELKDMLDEHREHEAREVIRRCQVAELKSLNGNMVEYITLKFKRIGGDVDAIFTPDALDALRRKMIVKGRQGQKEISRIYPLTVNTLAAKAMNLAAELGEPKVTAEIIEQL